MVNAISFRFSILSLFLIALLFSCKKDKQPDGNLKDDMLYPSYSHLDSGNYWVYALYKTDSLGNGTPTGELDSCFVAKDTVIRGAKWYKYVEFSSGSSTYSFLRDSLQYLVDIDGNILFASQDFNTVFYNRYAVFPGHQVAPVDTVAFVTRQMVDKDKLITVPAGTFGTSTMRTTWKLSDTLTQMGFFSPRILDTRYSMKVGKVSEVLDFYLQNPTYRERRLLRYHVK